MKFDINANWQKSNAAYHKASGKQYINKYLGLP